MSKRKKKKSNSQVVKDTRDKLREYRKTFDNLTEDKDLRKDLRTVGEIQNDFREFVKETVDTEGYNPKWEEWADKSLLAEYLKQTSPSDEIVFSGNTSKELLDFMDSVTNDTEKSIADLMWSKTIPLKDFVLQVSNGYKVRFTVFDTAIENLMDMPKGRIGGIACMQEYKHMTFSLLGMKSGTNELNISRDFYSQDGKYLCDFDDEMMYTLTELWNIWLSIQLALLHPKLKVMFSEGKTSKEYTREKDKTTGKRKRVVKYIKRHYIYEGDVVRTTKEFTRYCKAWYVIGHWRHYPSGKVGYVNGYWKGEMRELKRNLDDGRTRELEYESEDVVYEVMK